MSIYLHLQNTRSRPTQPASCLYGAATVVDGFVVVSLRLAVVVIVSWMS